jgi:hypothetical protein
MTEDQWLACTDSRRMLEVFRGTRLDPRLRRFAVECCRRVRHLIVEEVFRVAADAGEAFAEDPRNEKSTIPPMAMAASEACRHLRRYEITAERHQLRAARTARATCSSTDWNAAFNAVREAAQAVNVADADCCGPIELQHQAALLRCIFGPLPFREIVFDLAWLTPSVLSIARRAYDEWDFTALPVLADALADARCDNEDLLRHCRERGLAHCRGCWILDLLLQKG